MRFLCSHCESVIDSGEEVAFGLPIECPNCEQATLFPASRYALGVILDDFLIVEPMGEGKLYTLHHAHQLSLGRDVALKIFKRELLGTQRYVDQFLNEARCLARLNHPNVVHSYAVSQDAEAIFSAIELVEGRTLQKILVEEGDLPYYHAVFIMQKLADALDHIWYDHGMVHRDIKPGNFIWTDQGEVKLDGFRFSARAEDLIPGDEIVGSPPYLSPEIVLGAPVDVRSDLYSLGASFYHCMTGTLPFMANTPQEVAFMHIDAPLTPPDHINSQIPVSVSAVIQKLMAKNPEDRYQDPRELSDALSDVLESLEGEDADGMDSETLDPMPAAIPRTAVHEALPSLPRGGVKEDLGSGKAVTAKGNRQELNDFTPMDQEEAAARVMTQTFEIIREDAARELGIGEERLREAARRPAMPTPPTVRPPEADSPSSAAQALPQKPRHTKTSQLRVLGNVGDETSEDDTPIVKLTSRRMTPSESDQNAQPNRATGRLNRLPPRPPPRSGPAQLPSQHQAPAQPQMPSVPRPPARSGPQPKRTVTLPRGPVQSPYDPQGSAPSQSSPAPPAGQSGYRQSSQPPQRSPQQRPAQPPQRPPQQRPAQPPPRSPQQRPAQPPQRPPQQQVGHEGYGPRPPQQHPGSNYPHQARPPARPPMQGPPRPPQPPQNQQYAPQYARGPAPAPQRPPSPQPQLAKPEPLPGAIQAPPPPAGISPPPLPPPGLQVESVTGWKPAPLPGGGADAYSQAENGYQVYGQQYQQPQSFEQQYPQGGYDQAEYAPDGYNTYENQGYNNSAGYDQDNYGQPSAYENSTYDPQGYDQGQYQDNSWQDESHYDYPSDQAATGQQWDNQTGWDDQTGWDTDNQQEDWQRNQAGNYDYDYGDVGEAPEDDEPFSLDD